MPSIKATDERVLDMLMHSIQYGLWFRSRKAVRTGMDCAARIHPSRTNEKFRRWYKKACRLVQWLYLSDNRELWSRTIPYERCTKQYHLWRIACLERDDWGCQSCGKTKELNVHHRKAYKDYPLERLEEKNGITLCRPCHTEAHRNGK